MPQAGIAELVKDTLRAHDTLRGNGLERHVAELEILGYTVVPPEVVGMAELVEEARDRLIALAVKDGADSTDYTTYLEGLSFELYALFNQGRVFEQWLLNPVMLLLGKYLLGENMILNNSLAYVKGRTDKYLRMHSDTLMVPDPLPEYRHLVNMTLALTDYTVAGGCIGIVPGSHKLRRHPTAAEALEYELMTAVECPAGSLIVIPGNTWHGAYPKSTDGLRVTLVQGFSRRYLQPYVSTAVDEAILQRNPPEFARLLGRDNWMGFGADGVDPALMAPTYASARSQLS
jgi:ectoine hydroxylase-related dioxygenase (phytanoyl-CoA dioxygenase family)